MSLCYWIISLCYGPAATKWLFLLSFNNQSGNNGKSLSKHVKYLHYFAETQKVSTEKVQTKKQTGHIKNKPEHIHYTIGGILQECRSPQTKGLKAGCPRTPDLGLGCSPEIPECELLAPGEWAVPQMTKRLHPNCRILLSSRKHKPAAACRSGGCVRGPLWVVPKHISACLKKKL